MKNIVISIPEEKYDRLMKQIQLDRNFSECKIAPLSNDKDNENSRTKLRMYFHILGTESYYKKVSSVEEAKIMIDAIADFVNTKVDEGVFPDHCSAAGLEEYDEEEKDWVTWYDENGLDFDEHFRAESEDK